MSDSWLTSYVEQRPQCKELFDRAQTNTAGGVGHDMRFTPPFPRYIERALGSRMWDVDGNEYIDYGMGNGACLLGHSPPEVLDAVRNALGNGLHFGMDHPLQVEWAGLIQQLIPSAERVRFVNSGTEASMLALRVARAFTKRTKVLRFEGHFSGWHDSVGKGAMAPFDESVSAGIPPATLDTIVVIPADLDLVEETLRGDPDIAVVMLEPSGASWGRIPLSVDFNRELRRLTTDHGVLLIYDEVITGFRYSPGGYQGLVGITPDMSILGKIMTGGLPGGALVGRADIMSLFDYTGDPHHDRYERIQHLGTFNANPLSAAAGMATLKQVATGQPQAQADRMATLLRDGMEEILERERVAGYAFGDSSGFHVYLEAYPGSGATDRDAIRTTDALRLKGIPGNVVTAFQQNLQIRGVEVLSYTAGVTSSAHTEADINETLNTFEDTIRTLVREKLIAQLA